MYEGKFILNVITKPNFSDYHMEGENIAVLFLTPYFVHQLSALLNAVLQTSSFRSNFSLFFSFHSLTQFLNADWRLNRISMFSISNFLFIKNDGSCLVSSLYYLLLKDKKNEITGFIRLQSIVHLYKDKWINMHT